MDLNMNIKDEEVLKALLRASRNQTYYNLFMLLFVTKLAGLISLSWVWITAFFWLPLLLSVLILGFGYAHLFNIRHNEQRRTQELKKKGLI